MATSSPSPRRRQARGVATRARLLAAAEELLVRDGYAAASIGEIASRAGVGVGTLYHHFPDKRALLLALIDDWGDREVERTRTELDLDRYLGDDPATAIRADLRNRYEQLAKRGGLYLVLLERMERDEDVRQRVQRVQQIGIERLRALIELGQQRGKMRKSADPLAAAFLIRHAIDMTATEVLVHGVANPVPERVLEELCEMICRYILEEPR